MSIKLTLELVQGYSKKLLSLDEMKRTWLGFSMTWQRRVVLANETLSYSLFGCGKVPVQCLGDKADEYNVSDKSRIYFH